MKMTSINNFLYKVIGSLTVTYNLLHVWHLNAQRDSRTKTIILPGHALYQNVRRWSCTEAEGCEYQGAGVMGWWLTVEPHNPSPFLLD